MAPSPFSWTDPEFEDPYALQQMGPGSTEDDTGLCVAGSPVAEDYLVPHRREGDGAEDFPGPCTLMTVEITALPSMVAALGVSGAFVLAWIVDYLPPPRPSSRSRGPFPVAPLPTVSEDEVNWVIGDVMVAAEQREGAVGPARSRF